MEDDILTILFDKKKNKNLFNLSNKKLEKCKEKQNHASDELLCFISDRVHPNSQKQLDRLIENYVNSKEEYNNIQIKEFYKMGIIDGINLIKW